MILLKPLIKADDFCDYFVYAEIVSFFCVKKEMFYMLTSMALIFLLGLMLGFIFKKLHLPSLIGMLLTGIILGPYMLNLLDNSLLGISADLRQLALIIILTRAGLSLDINALKKVGRPAILMCFVPAAFEILAVTLIAPKLLGISYIEAVVMGSVLGAVSPAVIVPRMIKLIDEGYGTKQGIPQLIMAGASVDDVFVIVVFTSFVALANGGEIHASNFVNIPISIITGIFAGLLFGYLLIKFFRQFHMRDSVKVIIMLSLSFLLVAAENCLKGIFPFSGLLAIMSMCAMIYNKYDILAKRLSAKFTKLWVAAEICLFVLVGATVDLKYAVSAGLSALAVIFIALLMRVVGVWVCLIGTKLNLKERLFCMVSYIAKATVQAAIGSIPLSMGLACGKIVLTVAVLAIIITAPLGAFGIDCLYKKAFE